MLLPMSTATLPRSVDHPKVLIVRMMERIYRYRMTTTSGGNLSIRDAQGSIWITPARVDKGTLTPDDIVQVLPDGKPLGRHRPSSELPFHRQIYAARPDIRAIVHAHPVALVAFSLTGKPPETAFLPKAARLCGQVAFAPYELPGSEKLGQRIAEAFARGASCVMLENHGVVVGGTDLHDAFERFETLEFAAKTMIKAAHLGQLNYLPPARLQSILADLPPLATVAPPAPSTAELQARYDLIRFVHRGYRQRLLTAVSGSFSARVDDSSFVITPGRSDRLDLSEQDLVLVSHTAGKSIQVEHGKIASRASLLHAAIYARHPEVGSVVNAQPVNATAYSCSGQPLDSRTIPESYLFLHDVQTLPLEWAYTAVNRLADSVSLEHCVRLIEHNGCVVAGRNVLDAFDRLEVLETTAEALINARSVGTIRIMDDSKIQELKTAFGLL
jgi:L-fuculose-phosphate aldolase